MSSLERFAAGSPLSTSFPTPSDSDQWLSPDFADDLFGGTSELSRALSGSAVLHLPLCAPFPTLLTMKCRAADDDKLFDLQGSASFPDALSDLGTLQDQPNDRQVCLRIKSSAQCSKS